MARLATLLAALLLAACVSPTGRPAVTARVAGGFPAIVGHIEFEGRQAQATTADVAVGATISYLDSTRDTAIATTLSDATGAFALTFGAYVPVVNRVYILEAVKGLGTNAVGKNAARLRTFIRFDGTAWQSITSGGIVLGTTSTALCAIHGLKLALAAGQQVDATTLIDSVSGSTYNPVSNASAAEFTLAKALVTSILSADLDPLANLALNGATGQFYQQILANLAPDDTGDPTLIHDYVMTKSGVDSTFVWIPVFSAYQLIVPGNCGAAHADKPVGYWVAHKPTAGTQNTDWAEERFGGFYAGKYEASRRDAGPGDPVTGVGATAGSEGTLKVARYCVPWANLDWDTAALACLAYDAHAHLMRDDEWTALAVWATIHGLTVYGNNNFLRDVDRASVIYIEDPTLSVGTNDRALTGSGTDAAWSGTANFTTHSGTTAGVFDLNGNIWEWTETVGLAQTTGNYLVNDITLPVAAPGQNYISALATDPRLRRYGLPGATAGSGTALNGGDYFYKSTSSNKKGIRGGDRADRGSAGLWCLYLSGGRSGFGENVGFRPVLRF